MNQVFVSAKELVEADGELEREHDPIRHGWVFRTNQGTPMAWLVVHASKTEAELVKLRHLLMMAEPHLEQAGQTELVNAIHRAVTGAELDG